VISRIFDKPFPGCHSAGFRKFFPVHRYSFDIEYNKVRKIKNKFNEVVYYYIIEEKNIKKRAVLKTALL